MCHQIAGLSVIEQCIWCLGLWLRLNERRPRRLCNKERDNVDGNRPKAAAQRMPSGKKQDWGDQSLFDQSDLYVIPEALIYEICGGILS